MTKLCRQNPHLYEINSRFWLRRLREKYGRELTLSSIPEQEWKKLRQLGFDYIWLMGVWTPSGRGIDIAKSLPNLHTEYSKALPNWKISDIIGSPYSILSYTLNPELGKPSELKTLQEILHESDLSLILDFVPNHVAVDHQWTISNPEYFIQATAEEAHENPDLFFKVKNNGGEYLIAHGKDPNFPPWLDTAQLNIFNANTQNALIRVLNTVTEQCDGIRCDMAMLSLNEIFQRTWGWLTKKIGSEISQDEFWRVAIENVKVNHPNFIFIAEVYWGLNLKLLKLGFDYVYDKTLYDHLLDGNVQKIHAYLTTETSYQKRCVRFIENHDEGRAVKTFGREKSKAAAAIIATLPGLRFFHDGQLEGHAIKVPVQLAYVKPETDDSDLIEHYHVLLSLASKQIFHEGEWMLLDVSCVSQEDCSHTNLLAWLWKLEKISKIIVVNYSNFVSQGLISLPADLLHKKVSLDELVGKNYRQTVKVTLKEGLNIKLESYRVIILTLQENSSINQ
ncbi:MAG: alpha-amylase family glycosyl hydrolase [Candidatus Bathyarchaeota archaeon]